MTSTSFMTRSILCWTLLTLGFAPSKQVSSFAAAATDSADRAQWWRDAKFGLFVHWGPVSLQGTEIGWSRAGERRGTTRGPGSEVPVEIYDNLYKTFNPVKFNATEWVRIAQEAGMKYIVLVTRHHDGFSLWDTQASAYKITAPESPYGRDIVRQVANAAHAGGIRLGLYYSQPDWHNPDAFTERHARYVAYLHQQVRELMTGYGRIDILWFDGLDESRGYSDQTAAKFGAVEMHRMVRALQPEILINNRDGSPEDFDTPEQSVGRMQTDRHWESCITICQQWAWKPNDKLKSLDDCLRFLVMTVTGDGNLLLNVGPMPDGRIEPIQVERLKEIGGWLSENGEAIYGTRGGPWSNGMWGGSTYRGNTIYVHLLSPPIAGRLRLAPLPQSIRSAHVLNSTAPVAFTQNDRGVTLTMAPNEYHAPVTIVALTTAEPVVPGERLGEAGGLFADELAFGPACQGLAKAAASSGTLQQAADGTWSVQTEAEAAPALTFDLGQVRNVTGLNAVKAESGSFTSNASLVVSLSVDGVRWQEVWRGSYGLPAWEIPITIRTDGVEQPGRPGRFVRVGVDYSETTGAINLFHRALVIKGVRLYAK